MFNNTSVIHDKIYQTLLTLSYIVTCVQFVCHYNIGLLFTYQTLSSCKNWMDIIILPDLWPFHSVVNQNNDKILRSDPVAGCLSLGHIGVKIVGLNMRTASLPGVEPSKLIT